MVKYLLVVVVKKGWKVSQLDANSVSLHRTLERETFIRFSAGFNPPYLNHVGLLRESLYGLKKTSR